MKSAKSFRLTQNLSVVQRSQAHFYCLGETLSATSRFGMPVYPSGPCALAAIDERRDIAMGIAVHPGDIVSADDNGVMGHAEGDERRGRENRPHVTRRKRES